MARFVKGQSGNPAGRNKGGKKSRGELVREKFLAAFDKVGGQERLVAWCHANNGKNLEKLYGWVVQLLPKEQSVQLTQKGASLPDLLAELKRYEAAGATTLLTTQETHHDQSSTADDASGAIDAEGVAEPTGKVHH